MKKIAIIAQDKFLTEWNKELEALHAHIDSMLTSKFAEAEKYLLKLGLMPRTWNPDWDSGVEGGVFYVRPPHEESCKIEAGVMQLSPEVGDKLLELLKSASKPISPLRSL